MTQGKKWSKCAKSNRSIHSLAPSTNLHKPHTEKKEKKTEATTDEECVRLRERERERERVGERERELLEMRGALWIEHR
jgi:hypothetical protein